MMYWIALLSFLVLITPGECGDIGFGGNVLNPPPPEAPQGCTAQEVNIHVSNLEAYLHPGTIQISKYSFSRNHHPFIVGVAYTLDDYLTPFRLVFFKVTFQNQKRFIWVSTLENGTDIEQTEQNPPSPFVFNGNPPDFYQTKLTFIVTPRFKTQTLFTIVELRLCIRVETGGPLPNNVYNPCVVNGTDFYHPFPNDNRYFIQCNNFGVAYQRPCAYGTVWPDVPVNATTCV